MESIVCPFCRSNHALKSEVLAETNSAYLIANSFAPGSYLIIPEQHVLSVADLPDDWWRDVKHLITHIPNLGSDYALSLNIGSLAGQSVSHVHRWVIPRIPDRPSSGKGLYGLLQAVDKPEA